MLPHKVTGLGFWLNWALDAGHSVSITDVKTQIRAGTIFDAGMLLDSLSQGLDSNAGTAFLDSDDRAEFLRRWNSYANAIDEERKMGVRHNGLSLLVAYCIENLQDPSDGWDDPLVTAPASARAVP